jgi:hypothetical protein
VPKWRETYLRKINLKNILGLVLKYGLIIQLSPKIKKKELELILYFMKRSEGFFQKTFGGIGFGSSRVPLKSNVFKGGGGYQRIGQTGSTYNSMNRNSALLGSASPSNLMSKYYEKVDELRGYQLLDITKLATNFFADYIINFLEDNGQQVVSILDEDGNNDDQKTERINEVLTKDIRIFDYIRDHIKDFVFYGGYFSLLARSKDELGHTKFRTEELFDPVSVIIKRKRNRDGGIDETFLARGEDNKIYEISKDDAVYIGMNNLRLINDFSDNYDSKSKPEKLSFGDSNGSSNFNKVVRRESYSACEPLFYSLILKLKELIIKELLVSLISLRDLSSVQIFLLQFDKSTPLETANDLCSRTTKLANNTNELASFLTSQFDVVSFIENTLSQSAKFVPDYNSTIGNKNSMIPLDKLSDKLLDLMQNLDNCKNNVLSPLGIPATILDSTSGSKWAILQQSERANSKVAGFMTGIKDSVTNMVQTIYRIMYHSEIDPSRIRLHISEKTSVEYNNQINQSESISSLVQGISSVLTTALQTLEGSSPLIDTKSYLTYIQNLIKDIDPNTESLITDETVESYSKLAQAKLRSMLEQQGIDPSILDQEAQMNQMN